MLSEKLDRSTEALTHYTLASNMCPNRLRPLYLLMKLCDKPVKIPSGETARMKREAEDYMKSRMNY